MSTFRNNSGSRKRGAPERKGSDREEGKKPKSYKAKRSFTKNKSFRDGQRRLASDREGSDYKPKYKSGNYGSSEKSFKSAKPGYAGKRRSDEKEERPYSKKPFGKSSERGDKGDWKSKDRSEKPTRERRGDSYETKSRSDEKPYGKKPFSKSRDRDDKRDWKSKDRSEKPTRERRGDSYETKSRSDEKPYGKKPFGKSRDRDDKKEWKSADRDDQPKRERSEGGYESKERSYSKKPFSKSRDRKSDERSDKSKRFRHTELEEGKAFSKHTVGTKKTSKQANDDGLIRLNKYLSNAGIASRREADNLILGGTVKVNGVVVDQLGYKIKPTDKVTYGDSAVKTERKVYLLLNKPKDYITTMDDPRERKTVMELIEGACRERVYPVGRLDRNTTGLLLFTNDGELTTKLTHPKHGIKKVYHVTLNKGLKPDDFRAIIEGIELEDGPIKADDLAFVGEGKKEVGIEVHSGRNRIVRRIFEHLGYDVLKLDRVVFAGLTKKDLPRGKYRFLSPKEVSFLQMIG